MEGSESTQTKAVNGVRLCGTLARSKPIPLEMELSAVPSKSQIHGKDEADPQGPGPSVSPLSSLTCTAFGFIGRSSLWPKTRKYLNLERRAFEPGVARNSSSSAALLFTTLFPLTSPLPRPRRLLLQEDKTEGCQQVPGLGP